MSFTTRRPVLIEWGDCDPARIVYNPRFFDWFDNATGGLFAAAGFHKSRLLADSPLRIRVAGVMLAVRLGRVRL